MSQLARNWFGTREFNTSRSERRRRPSGRSWVPGRLSAQELGEVLEKRQLLAAQLQVTPVTWDVIGLDSNQFASGVGPDTSVSGVRITNTGPDTATNVSASFNWTSANQYINLKSGEL